MDVSTFLIILIIVLLLISIGFMIDDIKYRVAYFLVVCLFGLVILNIYLTIVYYIQLRNEPGLPGEMGQKGPTGVRGIPGKCSFTEECGIKDARKKIIKIANTMYGIPEACIDNPSQKNCNNNQDTLEQAMPINTQINMLEAIAHNTTMTEKDFMTKVNVCVADSNSCMDATDF